MKRFAALICAVLAALFLFSGCSSSALDPSSPVTVTLWHYYEGGTKLAIEDAVAEFNRTIGVEKGVIVDVVRAGSIAELEAKVEASAQGLINSDPMPDIFSCYPDVAYKIDGYGMLVDLRDYFTEDERSIYVDSFLSSGVFSDDRLLLIPVAKSTEILYVNNTAFAQFAAATGHSEADLSNWQALYDTAKEYHSYSGGKAMVGFDSVANFLIASCKQQGVEVIHATGDGQGEAFLDSAALRRCFDIYYGGHILGYFGAYSQFRSDDLKQNDLISYLASTSGASYFPTEVTDGNRQSSIDFLPVEYPTFSGGEAVAIQQGAGMCVAKSTPAREEGAALFLKFFTGDAQNTPFAMSTGYLPVTDNAYESDEFASALAALDAGSAADRNVAAVYRVALRQITELDTYAAKPFAGAYEIRTTLESTLKDITAADLPEAEQLRQSGLSDEEVLGEMKLDARFDTWLGMIRSALDDAEIPYTES